MLNADQFRVFAEEAKRWAHQAKFPETKQALFAISLKAVTAPAFGVVLPAPPVLIASDHDPSVDYACERCNTILLHAEEGQVRGLLIHCTNCGTYNSTDV